MARLTNLEMVQNILSAMDSDNVNSIDDVEESCQIEKVLEECYDNLIARRRWAFTQKTRLLQNAIDVTRPNKMIIPENMVRILEFRWKSIDKSVEPWEESWKTLNYLNPIDFIAHVQSRNVAQLTAEGRMLVTYNDDGVELPMITDQEPAFWTSFDDVNIYMDNFITEFADTATDKRTSVVGTEKGRSK